MNKMSLSIIFILLVVLMVGCQNKQADDIISSQVTSVKSQSHSEESLDDINPEYDESSHTSSKDNPVISEAESVNESQIQEEFTSNLDAQSEVNTTPKRRNGIDIEIERDYMNLTNSSHTLFMENAGVGDEFMGMTIEEVYYVEGVLSDAVEAGVVLDEMTRKEYWWTTYFIQFLGSVELEGSVQVNSDGFVYILVDKPFADRLPIPTTMSFTNNLPMDKFDRDLYIYLSNSTAALDYLKKIGISKSNEVVKYHCTVVIDHYSVGVMPYGGGYTAEIISIDDDLL